MDLSNHGPEFALIVNGKFINDASEEVLVTSVESEAEPGGPTHFIVQLACSEPKLSLECHTIVYPDSTLVEKWVNVANTGTAPSRIERLDSFYMHLPDDSYELMYYKSAWGNEFESVTEPLQGTKTLEMRQGRSSNGLHPWVTLSRSDGELLTGSIMWSGNWIFRLELVEGGGYDFSGGLNDWEFHKDLAPGEQIGGIHAAFALGQHDLNETSSQFARVGREYWYPSNNLSRRLPAEWNHWWSYEDKYINEKVFKQNVDRAAEIGVEVCTLDSGWFGPTAENANWFDYRGDWDLVNTVRFPNGIRSLSDYVHDKDMKFGLWCEIEALGKNAELGKTHPEYAALRDEEPLGYVCFGNPDVQQWAFETLNRLITDYNCDWIKLDFNLDPGAGCNREDHGHGSGDGLYEHYRGYYDVLRRIREKHSEVVLESCASGGLRIDLGLMKQTHITFLSDPDWPEHNLQVFWGASTMLAPNACLHWGFGEWIGDHPQQTFNPRDPELQPHQLDFYTRISMLNGFGFSQKFPELPEWIAESYQNHTQFYQEIVRRFVRDGDVYRLTGQPKHDGHGDRWAGFQYRLNGLIDRKTEHLCFVFRLPGGEKDRTLYLKDLAEDQTYTVSWLTIGTKEVRTGKQLMEEGLNFTELMEEDSLIFHVE